MDKIHCGNLKTELIRYIEEKNKKIKEDVEERETLIYKNIENNNIINEENMKRNIKFKITKISNFKGIKREFRRKQKKFRKKNND